MAEQHPYAIVIVGTNGAGKTTFYNNVKKARCAAPFINADIWERVNFPDEVGQHSAEAARWAANERQNAIDNRDSFVTEVVYFSQRNDALRKAKEAGYQVELFHIHVESAELARARVEERVAEGGHNVSKELIDQRYGRIEEYVKQASPFADWIDVFENSDDTLGHHHIMTLQSGKIIELREEGIPPGIERQYAPQLHEFRDLQLALIQQEREARYRAITKELIEERLKFYSPQSPQNPAADLDI